MRPILSILLILVTLFAGTVYSKTDSPPKLIHRTTPDYPDEMRESGIAGEVSLKFFVLADGSIRRIRTIQATNEFFEREAKAALKQWEFTAAIKEGKNVHTALIQKFLFEADAKAAPKKKTNFKEFWKNVNENIKGARKPSAIPSLYLEEPIESLFRRGIIETEFKAILPSGEYLAVVKSDNGIYYLADEDGFRYMSGNKVEAVLGGVFVADSGKDTYVWFMHSADPNTTKWKLLSGELIKEMKPGLLNILNRPTIDSDFDIQLSDFKLKE